MLLIAIAPSCAGSSEMCHTEKLVQVLEANSSQRSFRVRYWSLRLLLTSALSPRIAVMNSELWRQLAGDVVTLW